MIEIEKKRFVIHWYEVFIHELLMRLIHWTVLFESIEYPGIFIISLAIIKISNLLLTSPILHFIEPYNVAHYVVRHNVDLSHAVDKIDRFSQYSLAIFVVRFKVRVTTKCVTIQRKVFYFFFNQMSLIKKYLH